MKRKKKNELWLFDPKNKAIVEKLKNALTEKADRSIDLNTLLSSLKEKKKANISNCFTARNVCISAFFIV